MKLLLALLLVVITSTSALAAAVSSTEHSTSVTGLDHRIAVGDVISGLQATILEGDFYNLAQMTPADKIPAFTDDEGILGSGFTGLLRDFPGDGVPAIKVQYDLANPTDIREIRVLTGNAGGDGRIFSTFAVYSSTDGSQFDLLGYFESDPLGSVNTPQSNPRNYATLVSVTDDQSNVLAGGVTNLQFAFYAVDNTQGQYQDPFDGINPFTGLDDQFGEAIASPLVFEIDVIAVPEPGILSTLGLATVAATLLRRRRS